MSKSFLEGAVSVFRTGETEFRVKDIPVILRACEIFIGHLVITREPGGVPDGPVVVGIFQRVAGGGGDLVVRHVAEPHIFPKPGVPVCL